jgi:opacity protein-like surface antigen
MRFIGVKPGSGVNGLVICLLSFTPLLASIAQAEPYIAGQFGVTFPGNLSNVGGIQPSSGLRLTDLDLVSSFEGGIKAGAFFQRLRWLGVETEFFYTNPHVKQQNVTITGPGAPLTLNLGGAHMRVATWAFNLMARYPGPHFQPYAGVGLGIYWARISDNNNGIGTASDTSPGLNVLAGLNYLVGRHVGLFTEYKYNRARFDFGGGDGTNSVFLKSDYSAHTLVLGVGYHF